MQAAIFSLKTCLAGIRLFNSKDPHIIWALRWLKNQANPFGAMAYLAVKLSKLSSGVISMYADRALICPIYGL